jgi:hypothetical protein
VFLNNITNLIRLIDLLPRAYIYYYSCIGRKDVLASFRAASNRILICMLAIDYSLDFTNINYIIYAT